MKSLMKWLGVVLAGLVAGAVIGAFIGYITYVPDPSPDAWNFGPGFNAIVGGGIGAPIGALVLPVVVWFATARRHSHSASHARAAGRVRRPPVHRRRRVRAVSR
jgi:hypothetical protein